MSQKPKYCKNFERNSHWRKLFMIMVWERSCNASPKPEFFLFSLFIFSFISRLIWVRLGWNFHWWFSIQNQVNWWTIDPFSLKFCTSQHSYPIPLSASKTMGCLCKKEKYAVKSQVIFKKICENRLSRWLSVSVLPPFLLYMYLKYKT